MSEPWAWLLVLLACRSLANLALWQSGFTAISDDDFARTVIAYRFAEAPSFDPSGTSWLPLPFWISGSVHATFGSNLQVAHATAFVASLAASALCFQAARWLGLGPLAACAGSLLASCFPHGLWLGLATVPEGYTAALCALGIAGAGSFALERRTLAGLALLAATLCRYETWPLALAFTVFTALDLHQGRLPRRAAWLLALPLVGSALWLLHGQLQHGDALFFVRRVSEYSRALGVQSSPLDSLLAYPLLLLRREPELMLLALLGIAFAPRRSQLLQKHERPLGFVIVLLTFLVTGNSFGGAATHHLERPLLTIWILSALIAADAWSAILRDDRWRRPALLTCVTGVIALAPVRGKVTALEPFVDRRAEVAIGELARPLVQAQPHLLAIDCLDYGYHAVLAGLGSSQAQILRHHDPRAPEAAPDPRRLLAARWLIADHDSPFAGLGTVHSENARFRLLSLPASP